MRVHGPGRFVAGAMLAGAMLAASADAATETRSGLPPLPPPPPNAPTTGAQSGPDDRVVVASAAGDTIRIESRVSELRLGHTAVINGPGSAFVCRLANGDSLRLTGDTPTGTYDLEDGTTISLNTPPGYPRSYAYSPPGKRAVYFSVKSLRSIGVLAIPVGSSDYGNQDAAALGEVFRAIAQYRSPRLSPEKSTGFIVPPDWYGRAYIELPNATTTLRLVFFSYGESVLQPPASPTLQRGRVRFSVDDTHPSRAPILPATAPLGLVGQARVRQGGLSPATVVRLP